MMTTNLFVISNVKQLRTDGSFRILLPFFRTSWGVGVLNTAIFNSFHNRVDFGTILEGLRNFGWGGGLKPPKPRRYVTVYVWYRLQYYLKLKCPHEYRVLELPITCTSKAIYHMGHGCLCIVSVVWWCQVEVSAKSWSPVQRSSTECGASLCVI